MSILFPAPCLAVVGFAAEAALWPWTEWVVCSGGDGRLLEQRLAHRGGVGAVLSLGIAGGLEPRLASGTLVVADRIGSESGCWRVDAAWSDALANATKARRGLIWANDRILGSVPEKSSLHDRTGAVAVDMESGIAARFAAERGVPFAALRAVADPAEHALVPSAAVGLNPDGSAAPLRVIAALLRRPGDLPGVVRIALQTRSALGALRLAVAQARA